MYLRPFKSIVWDTTTFHSWIHPNTNTHFIWYCALVAEGPSFALCDKKYRNTGEKSSHPVLQDSWLGSVLDRITDDAAALCRIAYRGKERITSASERTADRRITQVENTFLRITQFFLGIPGPSIVLQLYCHAHFNPISRVGINYMLIILSNFNQLFLTISQERESDCPPLFLLCTAPQSVVLSSYRINWSLIRISNQFRPRFE